MKSDHYFEEIGDDFDNWMSMYDVGQRVKLIQKLLPVNSKEMSCLEVGCGTGKVSEKILPLVKDLTVSDISGLLSKKVGTRLGVSFLEQDACKLKSETGSFDLVVSSECIEHTPDPKQALSEMARVLKPGGHLVVTSPNKLWYPVLWLSVVTKIRKFDGNENWLFSGEATQKLQENGMDHFKRGGCHLFPWQIPFAKKVLPLIDHWDSMLHHLMINFGIYAKKSLN